MKPWIAYALLGVVVGLGIRRAFWHWRQRRRRSVRDVLEREVARMCIEHGGPVQVDFGAEGERYQLLYCPTFEAHGIICCKCKRISWNSHDAEHRYCGHCHEFLND